MAVNVKQNVIGILLIVIVLKVLLLSIMHKKHPSPLLYQKNYPETECDSKLYNIQR